MILNNDESPNRTAYWPNVDVAVGILQQYGDKVTRPIADNDFAELADRGKEYAKDQNYAAAAAAYLLASSCCPASDTCEALEQMSVRHWNDYNEHLKIVNEVAVICSAHVVGHLYENGRIKVVVRDPNDPDKLVFAPAYFKPGVRGNTYICFNGKSVPAWECARKLVAEINENKSLPDTPLRLFSDRELRELGEKAKLEGKLRNE